MSPTVRYSLAALVVLIAGAGFVAWLNSGYGEVGPRAYQYATALYSACNLHDQEKVETISAMIEQASERDEISPKEASWLNGIVAEARRENWDAALHSTRRLMEDQVKS